MKTMNGLKARFRALAEKRLLSVSGRKNLRSGFAGKWFSFQRALSLDAGYEVGLGSALIPLYPLLYLLPLGPIFNLVGCIPPYLRLFFVYALLGLPLCMRPSRRAVCGAIGLLAVMGLEAVVTLPPAADIGILLLAHQWVWSRLTSVPSGVTAGLCFYTLLHYYLFLSPFGYPVIEGLARLGNRVSGWMTGSAFNLGPTYQNLGGLLLFLCLTVFGWDRSRVSKARTASFMVIAVLLSGFLAVVLIRKTNFGADLVWKLQYREVFGYAQLVQKLRGLGVLVFPAIVFGAWLLAYLVLHYETWKPGPVATPTKHGFGRVKGLLPRNRWEAVVVACAAAFILISMPPTSWRKPAAGNLVFVERGVVSFTRPDYMRFGRAAGGMFGMLLEYANLFGCRAVLVRDIPETLDPTQILVLTNLDAPFSPEAYRRIWRFVTAGGKLWVMGDHTFIKNGRNYINDLLAPCHIALKHDSAQFFVQGWFNSYQFLQGTSFGGLRDPAENRPAILVGASLEVGLPAQPLILGRFGYSDWGVAADVNNQGYIGDFKYQPEERLGDLVLVAGERYGRGKVLVFGDTTSFFNNNLSRSYEILDAVLSWFGESPGWLAFAGWPIRTGMIVLLAGIGAGLIMLKSARTAYGLWAVVVLVTLVGNRSSGWLGFDESACRSRLAIIDFAHAPYCSKHSGMESGLHGVTINLMRYGLLPIAIDEWDSKLLDVAKLVVLNAPRCPLGKAERGDLMRLMERGGTVVLGCGYPHYEFSRSMLDSLQVRIRGLPLGRFFDRTAFGQRVSFMSAWPIEVDNPDASVICLYDDWPLMVSVPVGQGRLVLIGDSEFLHNRNIEGMENYDAANVQFIRSLLEYTVGGPGS